MSVCAYCGASTPAGAGWYVWDPWTRDIVGKCCDACLEGVSRNHACYSAATYSLLTAYATGAASAQG